MRPHAEFASLFFFHFLLVSYLANAKNISHNKEVSDFHVGVVLDFNSSIGRVGWNCIQFALSDFYATHTDYRTRLFLHQRDSQGDNVKASLAVLDLLQNVEVQAIIGPQTSAQAGFAIDFGNKAKVPIISFSATSPSLSFPTPYFVQATRNDSSQVKAITAIVEAFKWREVVALYENSDYGNQMISYVIDDLQDEQIKVPYRSAISLLATDDQIRVELYKMMNTHYRVFIVHMSFTLGARFFLLAKELGMMRDGYVWITTDGLMNFLGTLDATSISSMEGVLGVKQYVSKSSKLDSFANRWRSQYHQDLNVYGLWAYDTVWALAMAAEAVGETTSLPKVTKTSSLTDITTIKTSKVGPKLLEVILRTRFEGLSGEFYFVNGQLKSDIVQILNVNGKDGREVGFWTSEHGISKDLHSRNDEVNTTWESNLRSIIWPGDSVIVPKGWTIPASGKKLKIGVPFKAGFNEFARVDHDVSTNKTTISGYSIDVFNMVMEALPYPVAYEFQPFMNANGSSAGSNDECIHQVFVEKYDAVVGVSITENRSLYVDFTLPYSEGGVSMMVPIKSDNKERAWFFWRPLTLNLWLTVGAFFILTGFVIWVLEHRTNEDFRGGSLSSNLGIICCFPLSTVVFAFREKIVNNLTRLVVVVWVFVILILNSTYTASLSSILTVEKLQPSVTSVDELIRSGDYVGYQKGSFVVDLLKQMHFDESKLKPFISQEDMVKALLKGSQNGGIAAFFSRVPYIKLYIAKYGNQYTAVGPTSETEGFGFAFPKGSPLVADVSRAILKVSQSSKMKDLDRAFYATKATRREPEKEATSKGIGFDSFRVLFISTGTVSGIALLVYLVRFLYKNKQVLTRNDSIWTRMKAVLKRLDEKDVTCRTFKETPISYTASHHMTCSCNASPYMSPMQLQIITVPRIDINLEEMEDVRLGD
ncbi:hypothetical protein ACHQM5_030232 [Ranunculus cassubicifolius]